MRVRTTLHNGVIPVGRGVVGTVTFVVVDTPVFLYDNTLGFLINPNETRDADRRRLRTLAATAEVFGRWGELHDFQASRILLEAAAGQATLVGMGAGFGGLRVRLAPGTTSYLSRNAFIPAEEVFGMRGGASYLPRTAFVPAEELLVSPRDLAPRVRMGRIPGEVPLGSSFDAPHNALVAVVDSNGTIRLLKQLTSSGSNPGSFERLFPGWKGRAMHTEARASTRLPLQKGEIFVILGNAPPCSSCRGFMNRAAAQSGARIIYEWWENGKLRIWIANSGE